MRGKTVTILVVTITAMLALVATLVYRAQTRPPPPGPMFNTCVTVGTLVATPEWPRAIETLAVGDRVYTMNPMGRPDFGWITKISEPVTAEVLRVTLVNGMTLRCTAEHPIATPNGFVDAGALSKGDEVYAGGIGVFRSDIGPIEVSSIYRAGRTEVIDLTVAPFPMFIADGIVVHNKDVTYPPAPQRAALVGTYVGGAPWGGTGNTAVLHLTDSGGWFATATLLPSQADLPNQLNPLEVNWERAEAFGARRWNITSWTAPTRPSAFYGPGAFLTVELTPADPTDAGRPLVWGLRVQVNGAALDGALHWTVSSPDSTSTSSTPYRLERLDLVQARQTAATQLLETPP